MPSERFEITMERKYIDCENEMTIAWSELMKLVSASDCSAIHLVCQPMKRLPQVLKSVA